MRRRFASFHRPDAIAAAMEAVGSTVPRPVPHVPQRGNGLGNMSASAKTPVSQGLEKPVPHVPLVPRENDRSREGAEIEREECAAALEFDEGLSWAEAEALAGADLSAVADISPAIEPARAFVAHAPAIAVSDAEYDREADVLIAAAIAAGRDHGNLQRRKAKGHVIERGDDWIFVRGRW